MKALMVSKVQHVSSTRLARVLGCAQGGWAVDCGWVGLGRDDVGLGFGLGA